MIIFKVINIIFIILFNRTIINVNYLFVNKICIDDWIVYIIIYYILEKLVQIIIILLENIL